MVVVLTLLLANNFQCFKTTYQTLAIALIKAIAFFINKFISIVNDRDRSCFGYSK